MSINGGWADSSPTSTPSSAAWRVFATSSRCPPTGGTTRLSKKEVARLEKERRKLEKNLEGIHGMSRLPDAVFIVDTRKEKIAVDEARKLGIPIIGIVDTNCDPDEVDFRIPGNDDALRAIRLFAARIADAVNAGRGTRESAQAEAAAHNEDGGGADDKRGARPPRRAVAEAATSPAGV